MIIHNAKQVVCISNSYQKFKTSNEMKDLCLMQNTSIVVENGLITDIGSPQEILDKHSSKNLRKVDATNKCVLPGLVDAHTHPVFSGDRVHEFAMKLEGRSYIEIHQAGGGIMFTMNSVKETPEEELYELLIPRLDRMLKLGTTLIEAKSGYGIDLESEIKMLKVLHKANQEHKITVVSTFLPAHAVVPGKTASQMADEIAETYIPEIANLKQQGVIDPTMIDIFCEKGIFEAEDTKKILNAGLKHGLVGNFHGDELNPINSGVLAAETGSRAVSHLEHLSAEDISAMALHSTVGVLLPTTQYILHLKVPPAREMLDQGVPVALGSDFNPNAWCLSMPLVMHLACVNYRFSMNEALVASTLNAAASMGVSDKYGSIEVGKAADLLILDAPRWEHLIYQMVDPPISAVIKAGEILN